MTISFRCCHCNTGLKVPEKAAGKMVLCAKCQKPVKVPEPTFVEAPGRSNGNGQARIFEPATDVIEEMPAGWPSGTGASRITPQTAATVPQLSSPFTLAPPKPTWLARAKPLAEAARHFVGVLWQKARAKPRIAIAIYILMSSITLLGLYIFLFTGPPSEKVIKQAITEYVRTHGIKDMEGFGISQGNIQVSAIKIKDTGKFNKAGNYWPVRAVYTGSLVLIHHQMFGNNVVRPHDFTGEDVFAVHQDDFGQWKANILPRL